MVIFESEGKEMKSTLFRLGFMALLISVLAGCGAGKDGAVGPAGTAYSKLDVAALTDEQWVSLAPKGEVTGVTIGSKPMVSFKVTDAHGNPVVGLGNTRKRATDPVPTQLNLAIAIAKLVPGVGSAPSRWVNYIVVTTADALTRPGTDNAGTLVDNGDGTYQYTFYRDITAVKGIVDASTDSGNNKKADLDDLTYDSSLTHRVVVEVYGNKFGTGTNTADGSDSGIPAVTMNDPLNIVYDFVPGSGAVVTAAREIVSKEACNSCHTKIGVTTPHGGRVDTRFCVTCHTEQRKYGRANSTPAPVTGFPVNATTGVPTSVYRVKDASWGNMPVMVHKIHMANRLTIPGSNFAGVWFNEITYPQPVTNCVKCHDGSDTAASKTANGDNWKSVPSQKACGSCHDGVDLAAGTGTRLSGAVFNHLPGAQADDSQCSSCHNASTIPVYHTTVDPTGANGRGGYPLNTATDVPTPGYASGFGPSIPLASQLNLPAGVFKINYEIKAVTVTTAAATPGARKATVVYRILKDGAPVTFNATGYLMDNVDGSPDIYVAYATAQDGLATPADWNATKSAHVIDIRDAKSGNSQTGPDADGYYTAKLGATIPDDAKMITAAIGINYNGLVQLGLADYPQGIRLREPQFVMKVATGETARRTIVDNAKCNNCHGQLGIEPSFHSGARNNGEGCAICHDANRATGHVGPANDFGGGWSVAIKNLVHSIHSSAKREQAFSYEATAANPGGFQEVTYPAVLKNCEQCHVPGSYDFSNSKNAAAVSNQLWSTEAKGNMLNNITTNPTGKPSIGLSPWVTTLGLGQVDYTNDNLVTSPMAASCFGCHDSQLSLAHIKQNGGVVYQPVSTVSVGGARPAVGAANPNGFSFKQSETCMVCHASGRVADIKVMHAK